MINSISEVENIYRRRNIMRGILLAIVIGTLPFYCFGFYLWGTAPDPNAVEPSPTSSLTPIGGDATTAAPTLTDIFIVTSTLPTLLPTSGQFFPTSPPRLLTDTPPFFPSPSNAPTLTFPPPTLTPAPSDTPQPPTNTLEPLPPATDTLVPTVEVPPTATETATETPPDGGGSEGDGSGGDDGGNGG